MTRRRVGRDEPASPGYPRRRAALAGLASLVPIVWLGSTPTSDTTRRTPSATPAAAPTGPAIPLPPPERVGTVGLVPALWARRSIREYADRPLPLGALAQLLWAAQGRNDPGGMGRTAPSAGALYPLTAYVVAGRVTGLAPGVYRYDPAGHTLIRTADGDRREAAAQAALNQDPVRRAPAVLLIAGDYGVLEPRYGDRAERFTTLEAGHAGQNIALAAAGRGLATVSIGAFDDDGLAEAVGLPPGQVPLSLWPVGDRPTG